MKLGKLLKVALLLICLTFMLCACANSDEEDIIIITHKNEESTYYNEETSYNTTENILNNEEARQMRDKMFLELEDFQTEGETLKEVKGEELNEVDFSGCSIAVLSKYAEKIYERLSEENTKEFVDLLANVQIGAEENYKEWPLMIGGGGGRRFQITLKDGNRLYVGILNSPDYNSCIAINDDLVYVCDDETAIRIDKFFYDAEQRFKDKVRAALTQS